MKAASLKELKTELETLMPAQVLDLCMHLAKYKKENKELLTYLMFEAQDEKTFIKDVKAEIDEMFLDVNRTIVYQAKKTVRKILRTTKKYIKYSGSKQTEVELLIYFCKKLKSSKIPLTPNTALGNLQFAQVQKIVKSLSTLHEDLQHDYTEEMRDLL